MSEGVMLWGPGVSISPQSLSNEQLKLLDHLIENEKLQPDDISMQDENKSLITFWSTTPTHLTTGDWKRPIIINSKQLDLFVDNNTINEQNKKLFTSSKENFHVFLDKYDPEEAELAHKDAIHKINHKIKSDIYTIIPQLKDKKKCIIGDFLVYILI